MLVVDERTLLRNGEGGRYTVHVEREPLDPTATCEGAAPVYPDGDTPSPDEPLTGFTNAGQGCLASGYDTTLYSVDVPAGLSARVTALHVEDPDLQPPFLRAADSCDPDSCVTSSGSPGELVVANPLDRPVTYLVAASNTSGRPFVLRTELQRLQPNATCEDATPVAPGQVLPDQDLASGSLPEPICNGDVRSKLFYASTVPAGHRLWVDAPSVRVDVRPSCEDECAPGALVNEDDAPREVVLEASNSLGPPPTFDLGLEAVPLADNRTCDAPTVIRAGDVLRDLDARGALDAPFSDGCQLIEQSFPLFFMLEVPIGQRARVVVRPHDPARSAFSVQAFQGTCAEHTCVDSFSDYFNAGATEATVTVGSQGQTVRRTLVAVTNGSNYGDHGFDLEVVEPAP
jgi:hypothetical protein